MNASSKLLLLLLSSAAGVACGGSTTSDPDETSAGGAAGSGQAGSSQAGSSQGGAGSGGGKAKCAGPCVPTEWCQKDATTTCQCKGDGYSCPETPQIGSPGSTFLVCLPMTGECLPVSSPDLKPLLVDKFSYVGNACSSIIQTGSPQKGSDGTLSCCYQVEAGPCVGRPLITAEGLRLAGLAHGDAWA